MPEGLNAIGPYPTPPDERLRAHFREIIAATHQPEKIPGLIFSRPDVDGQQHALVLRFHVPRVKRPGGLFVPCAICASVHPKFLEGAVLWSSDGYLRLIGHVCAARDDAFGVARYRALEGDFRRKQQEQDDLEWLEEFLQRLPAIKAEAATLRAAATFLQNESAAFNHSDPRLAARLRAAWKTSGGRLEVSRRSSPSMGAPRMRTSSGASEYETEVVAAMAGRTFLRTGWKPDAELASILAQLDKLPTGDPVEALVQLIDQSAVGPCASAGRKLERDICNLEQKMRDGAQFLSAANIAALATWGAHPDNSEPARPIRVETIGPDRGRVRLVLADRSRITMATNCPMVPRLVHVGRGED